MNRKKYSLSKYRFRELFYFCQQYQEWQEELKQLTDTVKCIEISDMPKAANNADQTSDLVLKRVELQNKIELVENTAEETSKELKPYIIKAVTNYSVSYTYLRQRMGIPCGKNMYYEARKKFYWLLDRKMRKEINP